MLLPDVTEAGSLFFFFLLIFFLWEKKIMLPFSIQNIVFSSNISSVSVATSPMTHERRRVSTRGHKLGHIFILLVLDGKVKL